MIKNPEAYTSPKERCTFTGKLHIGCQYVPPPVVRMSEEEVFMQGLLLGKKKTLRRFLDVPVLDLVLYGAIVAAVVLLFRDPIMLLLSIPFEALGG